jgi:hypothetical protein
MRGDIMDYPLSSFFSSLFLISFFPEICNGRESDAIKNSPVQQTLLPD